MCKHCREDGVVQVRWLTEADMEDEDELIECEWYEEPEVPEEEEDEDEEPDEDEHIELEYCGDAATLLVQSQMVDEHLCARCARAQREAAEQGLSAFLEGTGMQDSEELLPLAEGEQETCDQCGAPATAAHRFLFTQCFCEKHAVASGAELPPRD